MEASPAKTLAIVGLSDLVLVIATPLASVLLHSRVYMSVGTGAVAVITLIGLLDYARRSAGWFEFRDALAATIAITWLQVVTIVAFFSTRAGEPPPQVPQLSAMMIENFTTVVGIVVAFYFGGQALERVAERRSHREVPPAPQRTLEQPEGGSASVHVDAPPATVAERT